MADEYTILIQLGDDLIPLTVAKSGTFRDLKRAYSELFDVPPAQQEWTGRIGDLGVDDDVRVFPDFRNSSHFLLIHLFSTFSHF